MLLKESFKKWVAERHTRITAERNYEAEKENTLALLRKEKTELENSLSTFDLHNHTIDYEGIQYLSFKGNIAYVTTKGENYTLRLEKDEDMFTFIKNFGFEQTKHIIVGRERWITTTPIARGVGLYHLPKLDLLTFHQKEAKMTLDLEKEIDVMFIRGLIETIRGKFSASLNHDKVNEALEKLTKELNAWVQHNFTIKIDAVDVHAFTFYAENKDRDTYKFEKAGPYNIGNLLYYSRSATNTIKEDLEKEFFNATKTLEKLRIERWHTAFVKYENEQLNKGSEC